MYVSVRLNIRFSILSRVICIRCPHARGHLLLEVEERRSQSELFGVGRDAEALS